MIKSLCLFTITVFLYGKIVFIHQVLEGGGVPLLLGKKTMQVTWFFSGHYQNKQHKRLRDSVLVVGELKDLGFGAPDAFTSFHITLNTEKIYITKLRTQLL